MVKIKWNKLIFAFVFCFLSGAITSIFSEHALGTWYAALNKPSFTPPEVIFGPIWIVLYTLMSLALYLFWANKHPRHHNDADMWFKAQWSLNTLWYVMFFGLKNPLIALLTVVVLFAAVSITIKHFWRIQKMSAVMLMPLLAWVGYTGILNLFIVVLNPR